jgi:hypothetical protein
MNCLKTSAIKINARFSQTGNKTQPVVEECAAKNFIIGRTLALSEPVSVFKLACEGTRTFAFLMAVDLIRCRTICRLYRVLKSLNMFLTTVWDMSVSGGLLHRRRSSDIAF